MDNKLFNAIMQRDLGEVIQLMVLPQQSFVGNTKPYEVDLGVNDAIDVKNLLIRTDKFIESICEFDDFSDWANRVLYLLNVESNKEIWDYEVPEHLSSLGIEVETLRGDYTYNDEFNALDRDIHYTLFDYEDESYVVFSVHYGADARVGFSYNVCFKLADGDYFYNVMQIEASLDEEGNDVLDYYWQVKDIATYNEEDNTWYHNETKEPIYLRSMVYGW